MSRNPLRRARTRGVIAVAASVLSCAPALANTSAASSLLNFKFTLIDLRPNDGIAPSVTFQSGVLGSRPSYIEGTIQDTSHGFDVRSYERLGQVAFGAVSGSRVTQHVGSRASVIGGSPTQAPGLSVSGFTKGNLAASRDASFNAWAYATDAPLEFKLSPHTRLVWSADYTLDTQTTHGLWNGEDRTERAYARAWMNVYDASNRKVDEADHQQYATFAGGAGQTLHTAGHMSVSVDNRSGGVFSGTMAAAAGTYGEATGIISAVPEPSTNAMLLAGLALVGGVAHRRRRAS